MFESDIYAMQGARWKSNHGEYLIKMRTICHIQQKVHTPLKLRILRKSPHPDASKTRTQALTKVSKQFTGLL